MKTILSGKAVLIRDVVDLCDRFVKYYSSSVLSNGVVLFHILMKSQFYAQRNDL